MRDAYQELVKLARICASNAHISTSREVARGLWRMALQYQHKAAALADGKPPNIGPTPAWFKE